MSKIIKSRQVRLDKTKYLLPHAAQFIATEEEEFIKEDDIPIKYIEEPADEEQPVIRPTPEEIRAEAKEEAKKVVEQAKKEATEIREKAQKEAEALLQQVQKEAQTKGYEEGFEQGKEEGIEAWKGIFQKFDFKVSELAKKAEKWEGEFPEQVIDLSIEVARRIIGEELEKHPEKIVPRVQEILKELAQVGEVIIKVSRRDYPLLEAAEEKLTSENGGLKRINIIATDELGNGDFLVETQFGGIDGRVKTQLEMLSEELKKRWRKNGRN